MAAAKTMSNLEKTSSMQFGLTKTKKITYVSAAAVLSLVIVLFGGSMTGVAGTILFIALGVLLGLATFFISSGWSFELEMTEHEIRVTDVRRKPMIVPLDKLGMLVQNGGFPFPTYWLVVKNQEVGSEIPAKGVDAKTRALIDVYQKRNPGKKLTIVPVPGGYLRSAKLFAEELKHRIPPLTIDERVSK